MTYEEILKRTISNQGYQTLKEIDRKFTEFATRAVEIKMLEIVRSGKDGEK